LQEATGASSGDVSKRMLGGLQALLKEGSKHFSGTQEACQKNIGAANEFGAIVRTSLGPNGMKKMVVDKHDKIFVTTDAATITKELEVVHPAARMLVLAAEMQEQECGDNTNLVITFASELLQQADSLINTGLHPVEIVTGYQKAVTKALELLEELVCHKCEDLRDPDEVTRCLKATIASKQYGFEDDLTPLVAKACIQILPKDPKNFNVDNVRVTKILGGGVLNTYLVKGFVMARDAEGTIKHVTNAKIAVLVAGLDIAKTETKGTVVFKHADELLNYAKGEENAMEQVVKAISESGAKVIVSGGNVGELAMHFVERYKLMLVKVQSKFQLRRICKATGATPLVRVGAPTPEELGFCDVVSVEEIGSTRVTVFRQDAEDSAISTIVVRASTQNSLDDIERAIDDGVNAFKGLVKDNRLVPGAGATEIELARRLLSFGEAAPGLDQYAIKKYAEAFEIVPRILAENSGHVATRTISSLYAAHEGAKVNHGVDIETGATIDAGTAGIFDLFAAKLSAIKLATDAAVTILRVDQIIMARPAGGPKPPQMGARDGDD